MATITCKCEAQIETPLPDTVDLDREPVRLEGLRSGDFLSVHCDNCGATVRPELAVRVRWNSRRTDVFVLPEIERLSFYSGHAAVPRNAEVLIGYPELFERIRTLDAGLDPRAVEIVKYYLQEKAEETSPEADIDIYFESLEAGKLTFHVEGVKQGEVGIVRLPMEKYEQVALGLGETASREPFAELFKGSYRSLRKLAFQDEDA